MRLFKDISKKKLLIITNFALIYFIWGSTYIWMKIATQATHPFVVIFWQNLIASIVLLIPHLSKKSLIKQALSFCEDIITQSFLMLIFGIGLITVCVQKLPASTSAVIIASVPIWVMIISSLQERHFRIRNVLNIISASIGILLLINVSSEGEYSYYILLLLATMSWSYGIYRAPKLYTIKHPYLFSALQMLFASLFYLILIISLYDFNTIMIKDNNSLLSIFLLSILGSAVAFSSLNWLLKHCSPTKVSTYAYINPIVSIFLASVFLEENIQLIQATGMIFIIIPVIIIVSTSNKRG